MTIAVMNYVWNHSKSKGLSRLVLLAIADNANEQGDAFPGIPRIARKCNTSERSVQNAINELEHAGELQVFPQVGVKTISGRTNLYRVVMQGVEAELPRNEDNEAVVARIPKEIKTKSFPKAVKTAAPLEAVKTAAPLEAVKTASPHAVQLVSPHAVKTTSPKPLVEPKRNPSLKGVPNKSNPAIHALINAWAKAAGYGLSGESMYTDGRGKKAKEMLNLVPSVTPSEIVEFVEEEMRGRGGATEFVFLPEKITTRRAVKNHKHSAALPLGMKEIR